MTKIFKQKSLFTALPATEADIPAAGETAVRKSYTKLVIRNLKVDMGIGVYDHEKQKTQPVIINVEAHVQENPDWKSDSIDKVVSYEAIVSAAQFIAKRGHIHLVETYAEQIAAFCLQDNRILDVTVRVEKPAIFEFTDGVGVEIFRIR